MAKAKISTTKPILVLLYGLPGSGKSHFARNISEELECAVIHSDRIRGELFEEPMFDQQEDAIVKHLMEYMTEEFLNAGVSVVFDTNALRRSQRLQLREMARKKHTKTVLIWFQIDADAALARLRSRDRRTADDKFAQDYDQEEFRRYAAKMQHPTAAEDYVVVSGKHTFNSQKAAFFKKLIELGYVNTSGSESKLVKPGLINLIPKTRGRVDFSRRNISIR